MLFNSYEFILVFLPLVALVYYRLKSAAPNAAPILWLIAASLFFYSWWRPEYLSLLIYSIIGNYSLGLYLGSANISQRLKKYVLIIGISANLLLLAYYKYANLIVDTVNQIVGLQWDSLAILLPLAISFFTFQQIAYLVDSYQGKTKHYGFLHYCLFVSFFPQLIAGPIVHHRDVMPQFVLTRKSGFDYSNLAIGLAIFTVGLAKKVLVADNVAVYSTPIFAKADAGGVITLLEAWQGVSAYSLQLYFDFSGYCDMAVGAARCFGIILPMNFNSPYQSRNIIEFWRRWHITLSSFLRDYLYIALGGNRKGKLRRYINLFLTMLLGGLWHGAGWNFVIWGGLHGVYLMVNHAWQSVSRRLILPRLLEPVASLFSLLVTLVAVAVAWVFFRAETMSGAIQILKGLSGVNGVLLPAKYFDRWGDFAVTLNDLGVIFGDVSSFKTLSPFWTMIPIWIFVCTAPNIYNLLASYRPVLDEMKGVYKFEFSPLSGILTGMILLFGLLSMNQVSEFLYFQF
ncbi:MAG: MBOAT family O-acyltransferase [Cellvibrionaceae bacterium]